MKKHFYLIIIGLCLHCTKCPETQCSDYAYQEAAQFAFDSNQNCFDSLDTDHDGLACEHLPSEALANSGSTTTGGGCPTTSNCGCSNNKKADCPSVCCQWIVGEGCKCKNN